MKPRTEWVLCAVFLAVGQFVYQALNGQHWEVAMERGYFQTMALIFAWWMVGPGKTPKEPA